MIRTPSRLTPGILAGLIPMLASGPLFAADPADTLYTGGPILTMNDAQPAAEAVAVSDGRIVAVGSLEEADKGSIETGKLADFVILSDDPTAIDPERLDTLKVLTTIKEDRVVFEQTGD